MNKLASIKTMLIAAGAFVSFNVGAAFASGNELLQFFGSWGSSVTVAVIAGFITTIVYCICLFYIGQSVNFEKAIDTYRFFGGRILGRFFQVFVLILTFGTAMLLFSGAGSLLWQQFGVPQWVGAVLLGVIAVVVVLGGLKTVQNVLGGAGIVIIAFVLIFGIVSLVNPGSSFDQAAGVSDMVKEGTIYQANLFSLWPFSLIDGLSSYNSPVLEGVLYGTLCIATGFPFYLSLGQRFKKNGEAVGASVMAAVAFMLCVALVLVLVMSNFDDVVNPETNEMFPYPAVAAVGALWKSGSWIYVIIIFIGIFTTYTGFLWSINHIIFDRKEDSKGSHIFVVVVTIFGICLGSVLPFSQIINILQPISGLVGFIMIITIIIKTISIVIKRRRGEELAQSATNVESIEE